MGSVIKPLPCRDNIVQLYFKLPKNYKSASTFYKLTAKAVNGSCEDLRLIWQRDLNLDIDQDSCVKIISSVGWFARDIRGKFTHYKILHQYYFTPVRLHKMGLLENDLCWKCKKHKGTFLHAIWACPLVLPFWREIIKTVQEWLGIPVPESVQLCLLGVRLCLPKISKPICSSLNRLYYSC